MPSLRTLDSRQATATETERDALELRADSLVADGISACWVEQLAAAK